MTKDTDALPIKTN